MKLPDLNDLVKDLQTAKELAIQSGNANSLVTATMAQAKLLGLDSGNLVDDEVQPVKVVIQVEDARKYDD